MEIRPSADLRNNYPQISKICKEQRKPIFLTVNGRGDTVLLSVAEYERQVEKLLLLEKLLAAKDDIINNRLLEHTEVFGQLYKTADRLIEDNSNET
ncbi:MAG: type II toxin-antitoxin system Phd/YefM family antitoxin [Firmicutes bacterium]|nr:type II toxin-antitoxin system Phd/YefM family antitoxin [Bacillota bacterium]